MLALVIVIMALSYCRADEDTCSYCYRQDTAGFFIQVEGKLIRHICPYCFVKAMDRILEQTTEGEIIPPSNVHSDIE